jgi:alpha-tubulin suppressor-like RCC1 family protein
VNLGTGRTAVDIAASATSTCALLDNNSIKCWGDNTYGQLGQGNTVPLGVSPGQMGDALPTVNLAVSGIKQIVAGGYHFCALSFGQLKCWGRNDTGQLGLGDNVNRGDMAGEMGSALKGIPNGNADVAWLPAGGLGHTCSGWWAGFVGFANVECWGDNNFGQLGLGDTVNRGDGSAGIVTLTSPAHVLLGANLSDPGRSSLPRPVTFVAAGNYHSCALLSGGAIKCWGHNDKGQLGLGDMVDRGAAPTDMGEALPEVSL